MMSYPLKVLGLFVAVGQVSLAPPQDLGGALVCRRPGQVEWFACHKRSRSPGMLPAGKARELHPGVELLVQKAMACCEEAFAEGGSSHFSGIYDFLSWLLPGSSYAHEEQFIQVLGDYPEHFLLCSVWFQACILLFDLGGSAQGECVRLLGQATEPLCAEGALPQVSLRLVDFLSFMTRSDPVLRDCVRRRSPKAFYLYFFSKRCDGSYFYQEMFEVLGVTQYFERFVPSDELLSFVTLIDMGIVALNCHHSTMLLDAAQHEIKERHEMLSAESRARGDIGRACCDVENAQVASDSVVEGEGMGRCNSLVVDDFGAEACPPEHESIALQNTMTPEQLAYHRRLCPGGF